MHPLLERHPLRLDDWVLAHDQQTPINGPTQQPFARTADPIFQPNLPSIVDHFRLPVRPIRKHLLQAQDVVIRDEALSEAVQAGLLVVRCVVADAGRTEEDIVGKESEVVWGLGVLEVAVGLYIDGAAASLWALGDYGGISTL